MKFHLITTTSTEYYWEVHKHNCADVLRSIRRRSINAVSMVEAASPQALIARELELELASMGYSAADFRVMPCTKEMK
jgi:hypothetical protein